MMANYKTCSGYDTETLYTLEDAGRVLRCRNRKIMNNKRRTTIYFFKQRLCGLLLIIIGVICPIVFDGDATFSLLVVPLGIFFIVTRQQVMSFRK